MNLLELSTSRNSAVGRRLRKRILATVKPRDVAGKTRRRNGRVDAGHDAAAL